MDTNDTTANDPGGSGILKNMWATRPVRLPTNQGGNAKIAGVAEGIGVRYRIDPTVVRVVFVACALFGGGIVAYLLCWLTMPRYSVPKSPSELLFTSIDSSTPEGPTLRKEQHTGWWLVVIIVFISGSLGLSPQGFFDASLWIVLGLLSAAWYGLHTRAPIPPQGLVAQPRDEAPEVDLGAYSPAQGFAAPYNAPTPPEWDPLGAAPSLWYLPDPPKVTVDKPKSPKRWVIVGAVVFVVAAASVASFFATKEHPGLGDVSATITEESQLASTYTTSAGDVTLDLSGLKSLSADREVTVTSDLGDIKITLPKDVPVMLDCATELGDINCNAGASSTRSGAHTLRLDVRSDLGNVTATP